MSAFADNSDSRESILASVRSSLAKSSPYDAEYERHLHHAPVRQSAGVKDQDSSVLDQFLQNAGAVGARCRLVSSYTDAAQYIKTIAQEFGDPCIVVSNSALVKATVECGIGSEIIENPDKEQLFSADVGITGAQWAIAETGTLVLESSVEDHRLVSLVPPTHVCILEASRIRRTLGEVLELTKPLQNSAMTFITGASRTSDIELTLAIGVHGPKELHIVVIEEKAE